MTLTTEQLKEMRNAVCEGLLNAYPMADKIAALYAEVAVKSLTELLESREAAVVKVKDAIVTGEWK